MRTTALACVVVAGLAIGTQAAYAGSTCSIIPSWCPAEKNLVPEQKPTSVPEPGTLILLAAGVSAVGGAVWRRKRAKKD